MEYIPDYDAQEAKRQEMVEIARAALGSDDDALATRVVDAFCQLTPPQDPPRLMTYITLEDSGRGGGLTRKPGNLRLNWRKLLGDFPDISLTVAGVVAAPSLIPFAALSIWNKLWSDSAIPLSPQQASALLAMWRRRGEKNRIRRATAFEEINALFTSYTWESLSTSAFDVLLSDLARLECIEFKDGDELWLREWVRTTYGDATGSA